MESCAKTIDKQTDRQPAKAMTQAKPDFDRLKSEPNIVVNIEINKKSRLVSSKNSILLYNGESSSLYSFDHNGIKKPLEWTNKEYIWDIHWSSYLNQFILLTDYNLYTYAEQTNQILHVLHVAARLWSCTCSEETILLIYQGAISEPEVEQYDMSNWKMMKQWSHLKKATEAICHIRFASNNSENLGFTLKDQDNNWHFELRNRAMEILQSVPLDNGWNTRNLLSLPTGEWLITHRRTKLLSIISDDGRLKQTIEYIDNIDTTALIVDGTTFCFLILTDKQLRFYDL